MPRLDCSPETESCRLMTPDPRIAFVISPFGSPYDHYWTDIFEPALGSAGYKAKRGDSIFTSGNVVRQIWEMISESRLVLADLSERNANVYYELGIAHALGKPCLLLTRDAGTIPFDLRGQRHIIYETQFPGWDKTLADDISQAIVDSEDRPDIALAFPDAVQPGVPPTTSSSVDVHLAMLQASVDSLRQQLDSFSTQPAGYRAELGLATADQLRHLASTLLRGGSPTADVVETLRSRGAPRVWAISIVDGLADG